MPFWKVEVAVVVATFKTSTLSPPANVEVAVVEVEIINPKVGEVEAEVEKVWVEPEETIERVVHPGEVLLAEKVWVVAVRPFKDVIPEPAAPEPKQTPKAVSKHPL
jgi:hypothetical protein